MDDTEEVAIPWVHNDGGYAGRTTKRGRFIPGNGVVRAIAIATGGNYHDVNRELQNRQYEYVRGLRSGRIKEKGASINEVGVWPDVSKKYLLDNGWRWTPTMSIGSGTTMHLTYEEIPDRPLFIAKVSRGLVTVINGVVQDIGDPSREGTRAVYGYYWPDWGAAGLGC
jgi:hypothetical protein